MLRELGYYTRMAWGLAQVVRAPLPSNPREFIRTRLLQRENVFLEMARRTIFCDERHPYRRMFQLAGCEFGDLTSQCSRDGLEPTLLALRREGVYLSHDEWKGKVPIVRGGHEIPASTASFRNPWADGWLESSSSGSSGRPVLTARSTAALLQTSVYQMLRGQEFNPDGSACWIDVKPILPAPMGLSSVLRGKQCGTPIEKWFSAGSDFLDHGHYRTLTRAMVTLGNAFGAGAPYPSYLPYNDFSPVVEYVARRRAEGRACFVHGFASPLVRIAAAALDRGDCISGTNFLCGGESLTPAKRRVFERAGTRAFSSYTISEIGNIGSGCRQMPGSCVHVYADSIALIGFPRPSSDGGDAPVNSLHFTTLAPHAPNLFINVEMDDHGVLETAACDCVYSRLGFTRTISRISSFGKATPQGTTFHATDLTDVIEELLPARLGGGPGDYQLVECEAATGQTQLRLYASPRSGLTDAARVREVFLEIMRPRWGGAVSTREWIHSAGVEAVIAEPVAAGDGKVHPVRLLGAYSGTADPARTKVEHA